MKKIILTITTFLTSVFIFSQNINEVALKHFNSYLNNKSVINEVKGSLTFNKYSNSLDYESTDIMYKNPTLEEDIFSKIIVTYSIPINNVTKIVQSVLKSDDILIISFDIYFDKKVRFTIKSKKKGELMQEETSQVSKISLSPALGKDIYESDIETLKLIIKDIFEGVEFEQVYENKNSKKLNLDFINQLTTVSFEKVNTLMINGFGYRKIGKEEENVKEFIKLDSEKPNNAMYVKLVKNEQFAKNALDIKIGKNYSIVKLKNDLAENGFTYKGSKSGITFYTKEKMLFLIANEPNEIGATQIIITYEK